VQACSGADDVLLFKQHIQHIQRDQQVQVHMVESRGVGLIVVFIFEILPMPTTD
jgi:hypothetical protein